MSKKQYKTLDSGKRINFKSGMKRDTQEGKLRYDLIIPLKQQNHLLSRWAGLMARGMDKYGYRNWEKANSIEELIRFKASLWRHFIQFMDGEIDEDHASAICFNLNAILFLMDRLNVDIDGTKIGEEKK